MALFVSRENQEMLWNVISNNTYIQQYFTNNDTEQKQNWFRKIVKQFYEKYENRSITVAELHHINKETINYMINNIREQQTFRTPTYQNPGPSYLQTNNIYTPPVEVDTRRTDSNQQFDMRQKEYQSMLDKKAPAEIDFRENTQQDQAIGNMDELVQQHMNERKQELEHYKVSNSPQPPTNSLNPILKIDNSSNNIQIEVEQVDVHSKKSVSWKDENSNFENKDNLMVKFDASFNIIHDNFKEITKFHTEFSDKQTITEQSLKLATMKLSSITEEHENLTKQLTDIKGVIENLQTNIVNKDAKIAALEESLKIIQRNMIPVKMIDNPSQTIEENK